MLKRMLFALAVTAGTATALSLLSTGSTVDVASAPPTDDDCRRPPGDDRDDRRPPPPPHRRRPPGHGPRCAPPVEAGVLPLLDQSHEPDPLCVAHNAQLLARFDADRSGALSADEWQTHLRERFPHHAPPGHGMRDHGGADAHYALVSASERQQLVDGANALSHVVLRLPLWFPLWLASLTTSNNEAVH